MGAQVNLHRGAKGAEAAEERRTALRYRFAKLLTDGNFEEAMASAMAAHARREVHDADLRFVVEIVRAAEQMKARQALGKQGPVSVVAPVSSPWPSTPA